MSLRDYKEHYDDKLLAIVTAIRSNQANMWTSLPAVVTNVSRLAGELVIEAVPTIQVRVTNPDQTSQFVTLPTIPDIPLVIPNGGGYSLTFPIQVKDEVLLIFSSRCIDSWWQSGGVGVPFEERMHHLSDGIAIAGPRNKMNVPSNYSTTTAQFRSDDGSQVVEIDSPNATIQITNGDGSEQVILRDSDGSINAIAKTSITLESGGFINIRAAQAIDIVAGNTHMHLAPGGVSTIDLAGGSLAIVNASSIAFN